MMLTLSCCKGNTTDSANPANVELSSVADSVAEETQQRLRLEFNSPEEMLAHMEASPDSARFNRGILRRMVETAPDYVDSLLNSCYPRFLVADKSKMRVFVFDSCGVELASFGMACGKGAGNKHTKGDSRTPEGFFRVEGVYNSTEWLFTDDNGVTSPVKGQFGPKFIRIKTSPRRWPIGIHGTCAPWSIGGRRSHGCMRLTNENILKLVEMVDSGMPVIIIPSKRDQKVNKDEGKPTMWFWTTDSFPDAHPYFPQIEQPAQETTETPDSVKAAIPEDQPSVSLPDEHTSSEPLLQSEDENSPTAEVEE